MKQFTRISAIQKRVYYVESCLLGISIAAFLIGIAAGITLILTIAK